MNGKDLKKNTAFCLLMYVCIKVFTMNSANNYLEINRESWNKRVEAHLHSAFYDNDSFIQGRNSLNEIELRLLGDLRGKKVLHLQCHFGQDTISLSRLGAVATGVDLSDKAVDTARTLAQTCGTDTRFICCDLYDLPQRLDEQFDLVFSSYGTIGWLPDMQRWAAVIARFLKPGGRFVFAEFHPVVWMFDDAFKTVAYNYFNDGAIVEQEAGTYADREAAIEGEYVMWNHGLGEVLNALLAQGLTLERFEEFDYSPYPCFKETEAFEPGKFRIPHLGNRIPMVFALSAVAGA